MEEFKPSQSPSPNAEEINSKAPLVPSLKEIWARERREGDPKINFQFVFSPHMSALDLGEVKKQFQDSDIYIPEQVGWDEFDEDIFSELSSGIKSPTQVDNLIHADAKKKIEYPFNREIFNMIYRSKKSIAFIDLPRGHQLLDTYKVAASNYRAQIVRADTIEKKVEIVKKYLSLVAYYNLKRESLMVGQIPKKIREILDRRTDLRKKPIIKVLISLGATHTLAYIGTKELHTEGSTNRSFSLNPFSYLFADEGVRRVGAGESVDSIDTNLLEKIAVEAEFSNAFLKSIKNKAETIGTSLVIKRMREIISLFSSTDIRRIYDGVANHRKFRDVVLEICTEKGIDMRGF